MSGMSFGFNPRNQPRGYMRGGTPGYVKPIAPSTLLALPRPTKYSDILQHRAIPGMSKIRDKSGRLLTQAEADARIPVGGFPMQAGGGGGGGGGGFGGGSGSRSRAGTDGGSRIKGYSFQNQGTAADYFRENGGMSAPKPSLLNQFYLNQPGVTMSAYDRLQAQKAMDETNPVAGFMADQAAVAEGQDNFGKADFFQNLLQDEVAQQAAFPGAGEGAAAGWAGAEAAAAGGGAGIPMEASEAPPPYYPPGETRQDEQGNTWRWNQNTGRGEMIRTNFADRYAAQQEQFPPGVPRGTFVEGDDLGEGTTYGPYGTASVTQDAQPTTFMNGHGSALGGVNFTGPQTGMQSAADFFQNRADFSGQGNRYAVPAPGYGGTKDNSASWENYRRVMATKDKLKA